MAMPTSRWRPRLALAGLLLLAPLASRADMPIIGILSCPLRLEPVSYIAASYVKWLQAAGGRVVPLVWDWPPETMDEVLGQVNGILMPGGGVQLFLPNASAYMHASFRVFRYATERGVPLWGTCLGFEQIIFYTCMYNDSSLVFPDPSPLTLAKAHDIFLTLEAFNETKPSRLWNELLPEAAKRFYTKENGSIHMHAFSMLVEDWLAPKDKCTGILNRHLRIVTTSKTPNGSVPFVSTLEGRGTWRVFGTAWHPEKAAYEENQHYDDENFEMDGVHHSPEAISAAFSMAQVFVEECRHSRDDDGRIRMTREDYEQRLALYNYPPEEVAYTHGVPKKYELTSMYRIPRLGSRRRRRTATIESDEVGGERHLQGGAGRPTATGGLLYGGMALLLSLASSLT